MSSELPVPTLPAERLEGVGDARYARGRMPDGSDLVAVVVLVVVLVEISEVGKILVRV